MKLIKIDFNIIISWIVINQINCFFFLKSINTINLPIIPYNQENKNQKTINKWVQFDIHIYHIYIAYKLLITHNFRVLISFHQNNK